MPASSVSFASWTNDMNHFPAVDPIPLPAPIWLMKALHIVTLALHFIAVEILLGSLLVAALLSVARRNPLVRTPSPQSTRWHSPVAHARLRAAFTLV